MPPPVVVVVVVVVMGRPQVSPLPPAVVVVVGRTQASPLPPVVVAVVVVGAQQALFPLCCACVSYVRPLKPEGGTEKEVAQRVLQECECSVCAGST